MLLCTGGHYYFHRVLLRLFLFNHIQKIIIMSYCHGQEKTDVPPGSSGHPQSQMPLRGPSPPTQAIPTMQSAPPFQILPPGSGNGGVHPIPPALLAR